MIVVDKSVWIDYFIGKPSWQADRLDMLLSHAPIIMGDIILTEILQGFRSDSDYETAAEYLKTFPCHDIAGCGMAAQSAQHYRALRKKGITVRKTLDVMIATFCITHDFYLLHNDRDFDPMTQHLNLKSITREWTLD